MTDKIIDNKLPSLTKEEIIVRVEMMIKNCTKPETIISLKNVLSYIKRLKE